MAKEKELKELSSCSAVVESCDDIEFISEDSIDEFALATANLTKQPDLMYVKFKLAHVGANRNRDGFEVEHLKAAKDSPRLKLVDWEHGEPVIGVIYHSEFKEGSTKAEASDLDKKDHIEVEAAIWKTKYPDLADEMVQRHSTGNLKFSMEALFAQAVCSSCDEVFASIDHPDDANYCECLKNRLDADYVDAKGNRPTRILRNFIFSGAGVVQKPADQDAGSLAVAKSQEVIEPKEDNCMEDLKITQSQLDEQILAAVAKALKDVENGEVLENLQAEVASYNDKVAELEKNLEATNAALTEATASLEEITAERDTARKEFEDFKGAQEADKAKAERVAELSDAGYEAPEDEAEAQKNEDMFMDMSEEVFAFTLAQIKSAAPVVEPESKEEDPKNKTTVKAEAKIKVPAGKPKKLENSKVDPAKLGDAVGALLLK